MRDRDARSMRYRLLALDLDGTLLDPDGGLGEGARLALREVRERGVEVVLCTGRRFRTALPLARALDLDGPIVVHNGALVKDIASGETRQARYLPRALFADAVALLREIGAPLVYVDRFAEQLDIVTEPAERAHPFQREYLADAGACCRFVPDVAAHAADDVIMLSTMAEPERVVALRERARRQLGERVLLHALVNKNYRGSILEFLAPGSGKWPAVSRLAASRGIDPREIVAIGDDVNDVEMIRGAGLGIAMGNAVRAARSAADLVVASNAEGGVVEALERVILKV